MEYPVKLDEDIRGGVVRSLPVLDEIKDDALRAQVVDALTLSLQLNGFTRLEDIPGSPAPGAEAIGTFTHHILVVAHNAICLYENFERVYGVDLGLDRDILVASAILHDVGKPYEYRPENLERWKKHEARTGYLNLRHSVYGAHIALTVGLPEEVVHVCSCHSKEGAFVRQSAYACFIHYADDGAWFPMSRALGIVIP